MKKLKKIKKSQKVILSILLVALISILSYMLVLAYLTSKKSTVNQLTIGNNKIKIEEDFSPPNKQMAKTIYKKKIQVENTGSVPCYVRVYADFSDGEIRDNSYFSNTSETLDESGLSDSNMDYENEIYEGIKNNGNPYGFYSAKRYKDSSEEIYSGDIYVDKLNEVAPKWVFIPDDETGDDEILKGYYYYTEEVKPGQTTPALFTYVMTAYDSEDDIKQYDIIVYGESVQINGRNGENFKGTTPWKEAWKAFLNR